MGSVLCSVRYRLLSHSSHLITTLDATAGKSDQGTCFVSDVSLSTGQSDSINVEKGPNEMICEERVVYMIRAVYTET